MNITSSLVSVLVGVVLPGLIALITRQHASDALKAFLTALVSAVSGGLNGALASLPHGWHSWEAILWQIFIAWVAAAVSYFTGWKPSGLSQRIARSTANFGLGSGAPATSEAGYARLPLFLFGVLGGALLAVVFSEVALRLGRELLTTVGILATTAVAVLLALLAEGYRSRWTYPPSRSLDPGIVPGHERDRPRIRT